jgi:hypothetical protein
MPRTTPTSKGLALNLPQLQEMKRVGVTRVPDEELAWLEAEEEKIRKRKSELIRQGGRS